jgi:serine phosphatase RsbU (regulator of sigma subunit)
MKRPQVEVGVADCSLPGEFASGDRCVVKDLKDRTLIAVIDGLGHGPAAARAADAAARVIDTNAPAALDAVLVCCHEALRDTRGAAITLLALDGTAGSLEWVGVGNVAAALFHAERTGHLHCKVLFTRGGFVGMSLPSVEASRTPLVPGDFVVVATDGLEPGFLAGISRHEAPQVLADRLLDTYHRNDDDALVAVACFHGNS